jgi:hypothetical protein
MVDAPPGDACNPISDIRPCTFTGLNRDFLNLRLGLRFHGAPWRRFYAQFRSSSA